MTDNMTDYMTDLIGYDPINHPSHYTAGKIECIDALEAATINLTGSEAFCTANAIKYLWRWKQKNGIEDLRKAVWYIERLIGHAEEDPHTELAPRAGEAWTDYKKIVYGD